MRTIVIGGGISGLACAYRLRELGIPVLLLEEAQQIGGVIDSIEKDGFLFELGPQSFLSTDVLSELITALGLTENVVRADPHAARYVLIDGQLHPVPMSPPALLATSLLSPRCKRRLLSEALRRSQPPESDESVADFVRRKFSQELLERLVGPFVSGVHAGDPEKLSLRSAFPSVYQWEKEFGSVIRGAMKSRPPKGKSRASLCSFKNGVATLVRALGEKLTGCLHCGVSVVSVPRGKIDGKSQFELRVNNSGRTEQLSASAVVVATPAQVAGHLLADISGSFLEHFSRIEYAPVAVVGLCYRREQVAHATDGFGFLVPRKEGLRLLGSVWSSSLFPGRAPEGTVNFANFAGGATDTDLFKLDAAGVAEIIARELATVLRISGAPITQFVRCHSRALPQYNLGHGKTIAALRELAADVPGLFLTGNYFDGAAIGACVEHAFQTAESTRQYLASIGRMEAGKILDPSATTGNK